MPPLSTPGTYRGRFAPSPTGPLHFGSLVAAAASYLQARQAGGEWLLRIEDIDPPREMPGASQQIIDCLRQHGFEWSGDTGFQSQHRAAHAAAVECLLQANLAYACTCSRSRIQEAGRQGPTGPIYPGTCRNLALPPVDAAIRVKTAAEDICFVDELQGQIECELMREVGDFVIQRRDGLIAYALAVVIDDSTAGITEVVRGIDLLEMTPAQIWLQRQLGLPTPGYLHIPVATDRAGKKLSKQTHAPPVDPAMAKENLLAAFDFLGLPPGPQAAPETTAALWAWATDNWEPARLAGCRSRAAPDNFLSA